MPRQYEKRDPIHPGIRADFVQRVAAFMRAPENKVITYRQLAGALNLDESQVSKICRGVFETWSPAVRKICRLIDYEPFDREAPGQGRSGDELRVRDSAVDYWDKSVADADRIVELFRQLKQMREERPASRAGSDQLATPAPGVPNG